MSFTFYFPEVRTYNTKPRKARFTEPSVQVALTKVEGRDSKKDCAVRALASFMDMPYSEALSIMKQRTNYSAKGGTNVSFYNDLLQSFGLVYVEKGVRLNSKTAKDKLPRKAILLFRSHVAAYEDGTIYDTWYCTNEAGTKQTKGYWTYPE